MRTRPNRIRVVLAIVGLALLFAAADAGAVAAAGVPVSGGENRSTAVTAPHAPIVSAPVSNASRTRRLATFGAVLSALFVVALWLSWPCATRVFRARPTVARFSIRRRGPPSLLAAC